MKHVNIWGAGGTRIRRRVVAKCGSVLGGGGPENSTTVAAIDDNFHSRFQAAYEDLAGRGERVLACAKLDLDGDKFDEDFDFTEDNFPQDGDIKVKRFV